MEYGTEQMKRKIREICRVMTEAKQELTEIDSRLGDGDMGMSMEQGANAVLQVLEEIPGSCTMGQLFMKLASAFNKAAPSTMGTLLSAGIMGIARAVEDKDTVTEAELVTFPMILAEQIQKLGKASVGDKTILDALCPYAERLQQVWKETADLQQAAREAYGDARRGMESTKGMAARTGRAKWLGERNCEVPDGGCVLWCRMAEYFVSELFQ